MNSKTPSRHVLWARKRRDELRAELGGKCVKCGTTEDLEFDHIDAKTKTWTTKGVGFVRSITLYWRDHRAGLLQLLCRSHNASKGNRVPNPELPVGGYCPEPEEDNCPF